MFKSKKNPAYYFKFGDLAGLKNTGLFWSTFSKFKSSEIERVFNFVIKTNYTLWRAKTLPYVNKVMHYDYRNKVFNRIIKSHTNWYV